MGLVVRHIVMEHAVMTQYPGIFSVQQEYDTNNEHVEALKHFLRGIGAILDKQTFVHTAHQRTSLQGNLQFLFDMVVPGVHQEVQTVILFGEIFQL